MDGEGDEVVVPLCWDDGEGWCWQATVAVQVDGRALLDRSGSPWVHDWMEDARVEVR